MSNQLINWNNRQKLYTDALTVARHKKLASELGVKTQALSSLGLGWCNKSMAYTFPERDSQGEVIGILRRAEADGQKRVVKGSKRGLYFKSNWKRPGPIYLPEGASDTAVLISMGLNAIGRPNCNGGAELLAGLLAEFEDDIFVIGENDEQEDGSWPGRDGAIATARSLSDLLKRKVFWTLPPSNAKDVRDFIARGGSNE